MIVVTAELEVAPDSREAFVELATEMCRASRREPGCIDYRVHAELERPDHFLFLEEWQDDAALQSHFAEPHTAKFMAGIGALLSAPADALFHTIASTGRLGRSGLEEVS